MAGGLGSSTDPWSWGANWYGELGTNVTPGTGGGPTPAQIIGFGPVSGLSAGTNHALALKSNGSVWGWGLNESGQVGNPAVPGTGQSANPASATSGQSTPIQVVGAGGSGFLSNISAVSAGGTHSVALKSDGTVWAWARTRTASWARRAPTRVRTRTAISPAV